MTGIAHPAKFSKAILEALDEIVFAETGAEAVDEILDPYEILDPFAGVGKIHRLHRDGAVHTTGVELEPEWAGQHPRTIVGDATDLPFDSEVFDAVITSPCYGNRMADTYDGMRDTCTTCRGSGRRPAPDQITVICGDCAGAGVAPSRRHTYTIALGRTLTAGNAGAMQWGREYRELHVAAWNEALRVLRPGGLLVVNISNHVRKRRVVPVVEWHLAQLVRAGMLVKEVRAVETRRMRHGENHEARVDSEHILVLRRPAIGGGS